MTTLLTGQAGISPRFYWILAHVCVDSVTFTCSTSQLPSPELAV